MPRSWIALAAAVMLASVASARADTVADFYKGKTVQLVLGYGPGGGYDVYARSVARFLGKFIPGNPNVVVVNMPGAGSLRATNYLYTTAPKDGLVIGAFARDMPLMGILGGNSNVQFDPRKFTWLGSASSAANDAYLLFTRKDAPVKTIEAARDLKGPKLNLGGTAEGATGNDVAVLLRDTIGLNVNIITGYPDSGALFLAADRKEIDGRFVGLSAVQSSKKDWLTPDSNMHVLMQFARATRHPMFPDAPTARELAKDKKSLDLIEIAELPYTLSRPLAAPPGLPPERAEALQNAFTAMLNDAEFRSEAEKLGLDVSPVDGKEALRLIDKLAASSPDLLDYIKKMHADGK
jgi:tripartite-type tricarboxylate transporter receptor subunit TctC